MNTKITITLPDGTVKEFVLDANEQAQLAAWLDGHVDEDLKERPIVPGRAKEIAQTLMRGGLGDLK